MRTAVGTRTRLASGLCLLLSTMFFLAATAIAAPAGRYLHVNVEGPTTSASVHINVPLSMAAAILPAINNTDLHDGKVSLHASDLNGVDLPTLLQAVRNAPDDEFVTVNDPASDVRVAKHDGNIIVHVVGKRHRDQKVDVTVPLTVADALVGTAKDGQLDVAAALRALDNAGDILLVTAHDSGQVVRVWVDSRNTQ